MREAKSEKRLARRNKSKALVPIALMVGSVSLWGGITPGCGGRTQLSWGPPQPECFVDGDCPGATDLCKPVYCDLALGAAQGAPRGGGICVDLEPVNCDDGNECTEDKCVSKTAQCTHEPTTLDKDGDGFRGPLAGFLPGAPGSCGDDCDDTSELAYPGNVEVCDGVDNDCNTVIDDGAAYVPLLNTPIRLSGDMPPAGPGGLAWSGSSYAAVWTGTTAGFEMRRTMLAPTGDPLAPAEPIVFQNGDNAGGPIVWVGDRYGVAWQDRRSGDYEVYFTLLDENGAKVLADQRLTDAPGFSINTTLTWTGTEFVAVWQDERDGIFDIYGQRLSLDGAKLGGNVKMTQAFSVPNEGPQVAAGLTTIGMTWSVGDPSQRFVNIQIYNQDLSPNGSPIALTNGATQAVYPTVAWNQDRYMVVWFDKTANPKAIYGAVVSEGGTILAGPKVITQPGQFRSRYPTIKPLGDRALLIYADDRDQNDGYELYSVMLDAKLDPISQERRITFAKRDSIYPIAAFGPDGNVGILFRDDRDGDQHAWFTRLGCVVP
ncbi:MAG TPA: putative metal-binding motif-containing protein [Polyangium sp.]|jgi:hypothetical protein|nr:putative metal-binding motif-containing protein [Polyangium sp.]